MSKRYETNETSKGCKTAWTKWTFKTRRRTKTNLYTIIIKLTLIHKNITNPTNEIIVCVHVWVCVCVCVCLTQLSYKRITYLKCPFLWLETGSFSETGKRPIVNVYFECQQGPCMLLLRSPVDSRWRECVAAAKKFGKRGQGCLKTPYL